MLVLLEQRGLVQRDVHPTDSRARTVALSPEGKRKFRQLWTAGDPIRAQMVETLEPDEVETLVNLLTKVAQSLNLERGPNGGESSEPTEKVAT